MECLASFVVLFVLPLAAAALVLAWRARAAARQAREEAAELAATVRALAARLAVGSPEARAQAATAATVQQITAPGTAPQPPTTTGQPIGELPRTAPPPPALAPRQAADVSATPPPPRPPPATSAPPVAPPALAPPQPPGPSLEERLGARLPIWIGAVALVLAAAFLVKYSVDQGWIGPTVRVTLGALFGVALLVGGELLRRSSAAVAQGLTAAGIAVLFVVEIASLHLYHLIGPTTGFALLALTTATAVALALRQGPLVAVLGLVGGFLTPLLVSTGQGNAPQLFSYLALLQAGLFAVSRRQTWTPLAGLNLAAALVWAGGWALSPAGGKDATVVGVFLLLTVVAAVVAGAGGGARFGVPLGAWVRAAAAGGALIVAGVLAVRTEFALTEWGFVGLLAAGCLVLARLSPELEGLSWLAAATVALLLVGWAERVTAEGATRFVGVAAAAMLLLGGGTWLLRRGAGHPARWASLAAAASLAIDLVAWRGAGVAKLDLPWGWIELALAAVWILLALPVARRRASLPGGEGTLAAAAVAATTFVSLAVPMELERQWITVAWALEVAALVWLAGRLRVPLLAHLAALLTALVGARLLLNPEVLSYPTGTNPYVSWLLYGYGVPIAALAAAAVLARRQERRPLAAALGGVAVALAVAFLALAVRQAFHPGLTSGRVEVAEWGSLTALWLALACGLLLAAARARGPADAPADAAARDEAAAPAATSTDSQPAIHPYPEVRWGGLVVATLAVVQALVGQGVAGNPLLFHLEVGTVVVFNALLLAYGVPVVLLLLAARLERRVETTWQPRWPIVPRAWSVAALPLLFLLVTLEVRQAFRGTYLDGGAMSAAERYAYSAAWVLLATGLLVGGLVRHSRALRLASLPVMLLAVGKVFLYDTSNLSDLYRVFSFLGLGVSLLLLAWLYQRFVFRARPELP